MKKIFYTSLAGFSMLLLLNITLLSCDTTKPILEVVENKEIASKLKGEWFLKTIDGTDVSDAFKGTPPSIRFDMDSKRVSGNGGCNTFNGAFALVSNVFTPSPMVSTMMACAQANEESKLLKLLGQKSTLVFNNYSLQFIQNNKVVLVYTPKTRSLN